MGGVFTDKQNAGLFRPAVPCGAEKTEEFSRFFPLRELFFVASRAAVNAAAAKGFAAPFTVDRGEVVPHAPLLPA